MPLAAARRLAFYATADGIGVLAPRGWHFFGAAGSNGVQIIVAPRPLDWKTVFEGKGLLGPEIQLTGTSGATSGRFEVAAVAARVFPAARSFVAKVEAEGMGAPYPRHPFTADRLRRRGAYGVLYTTPAHEQGLGTRSHLHADDLPIDGFEKLSPDGDMDLKSLAARLSPRDRLLVAYIIRVAWRMS